MYHVLDRGDRREAIFRDDEDRQRFLDTLAEACGRTGWRIHAYVLISNHYHLLLETPEPNLVAGMKWFQGTYSIRFNCRHKLRGHLFQGRYKAVVVDPEERRYFVTLSDYIHLNPVRAGLIGLEERLVDYRWSSYPLYVRNLATRPPWMEVETVLGELGLEDRAGDRRRYAEHMRRRASDERKGSQERGQELQELRRGWCLGGVAFRRRALGMIDGLTDRWKRRKQIDGGARREHSEGEAASLVEWALRMLGLTDEELARMKKSDARKIAIGRLVRKRTLASNGWIGARLSMGDATRVSRYCGNAGSETDRSVQRLLSELEKKATCKDCPLRFLFH
ncbi:MAG: transposase [Chthoniobacter sp.]|uniref:transposase n=1 Tax=Chthoniobacter sp. TaxID=2510640 RepID=UPI0032AB3C62